MSRPPKLVLLGFGQLGRAVLADCLRREAQNPGTTKHVLATTRSLAKADDALAHGFCESLVLSSPDDSLASAIAVLRSAVGPDDEVIVSFPPDGVSDAAYAPVIGLARRIVYISSTGVYGAVSGHVDEKTPADPSDARAAPRIAAEEIWRSVGGIVLRAPAIYGSSSGLHKRLLAGTHRLVEDGNRHVSRIHVDDLAVFALAALERAAPGSTYVVGDDEPATQRAVVEWLCARLGLPLPPAVSVDEAPPTLRGNRIVEGSYARRALGVTLRYPTYREGYGAIVEAIGRV